MVALIHELVTGYHKYFVALSDQRTLSWPLLGSPFPILAIIGAYLWLIKTGGPKFMENRQPYKMDGIIQIYNVVQVVVNGYLCLSGFLTFYGPNGTYNIFCEPLDMVSEDENTIYGLKLYYVYFLVKVLDLMDTVFFILRKKFNQASFLHVYHHTLMVVIIWFGMKFLPGGHGIFLGIINSFVHTVMYTYYFLTNWNKEYRKNLWWKKYLTQLQLLQFFLIFIHFAQFLLFQDCDYPRIPVMILTPQVFFITTLFADFYWKTYIRKPHTVKVN